MLRAIRRRIGRSIVSAAGKLIAILTPGVDPVRMGRVKNPFVGDPVSVSRARLKERYRRCKKKQRHFVERRTGDLAARLLAPARI